MSSVNKVIIIGRLGKDPEAKEFSNGGGIVNLTVATSERWKDKATGEQKERTEWHKVTINNTNIQNVAKQYLKKGDQVYIEGQLQTRKWTDNDGRENYTTEIVVGQYSGKLVLIGGGKQEITEHSKQKGNGYKKDNGYAEGNPNYEAIDLDDEVPF